MSNELATKHHKIPRPPDALQEAYDHWVQRGRPQQAPTRYRKDAWRRILPEHADLIDTLAEELDRATVRVEIARLGRDDRWPVPAFIITQIWGYGPNNLGPARVRRVLDAAGDQAPVGLAQAARRVTDEGAVAGFSALAGEHRLTWLSTSFATKYLFFMDPSERALVLDEFVATWIGRHTGARLRLQPMNVRDYRLYLRLIDHWAQELGEHPSCLEQLIFETEATERGSAWVA